MHFFRPFKANLKSGITKIFCSLRSHGASFRSFAPGPPKLLDGPGVGGGNCKASGLTGKTCICVGMLLS